LFDGRIDLAVHSLKDLPTTLPDGLATSAICKREDPRDALVMREDVKINSLQEVVGGSVVGTSSPRRLSQLKSIRSDLIITDMRGNVDSRLRKLDDGQYDALILAVAGLKRLGLDNRISFSIATDDMLPAVGQGAIAIETRSNDESAQAVAQLDHEETRLACLAERAFLRSLGGGCQLPIAAHAIVERGELHLEGLVATLDGSVILREKISGPSFQPDELGLALADKLNDRGASSLL
jgi:hydroxymethylbilane synthase